MWKYTCLLLMVSIQGLSQAIISLSGTDLPDANLSQPAVYDLETLWNYNSSPDLFVEFGFNSLMVQEVLVERERIKVEIYKMSTPEGAFGAYSLSVLTCLQRDTLCAYDCNNIYQYQAAYGNLYICISSESGSTAARSHYLSIARAVLHKNQQETLVLPQPFDFARMTKVKKNLVYIQGQTALQNSLFPWQDLFLGVRYGMFAILMANSEYEIYFARIRFETPVEKLRFLRQAGLTLGDIPVPNTSTNDGLYREFQQADPDNPLVIFFLQSQEPYPISAVINSGR